MNIFKSKIAALATLLWAGSASYAATFTVQMQNNFFSPSTLNIKQGDTVTWVASTSGHDTESYDGLWSSGILQRGRTFSFTFNEPGSFSYKCNPHENFGMTGTINVEAAANTPPTVSITSPAEGGTFAPGDTITFAANATDNGGVASVEFFANSTSIGSSTTAPFGITTTLAAGTYAITATATDNLGASATSPAVNITVAAQNTPPEVTLTSPAGGATFSAADDITFAADATDNGRVTSVEFFANGNSVGKATASPFSVAAKLQPGSYSVTAKATDNLGASSTTDAVNITVNAVSQNQLPTVTLAADQTLIALGGILKLTATASDADGTIANVQFLNGANAAGEKTAAPYELEVPNLAAGTHSFTAVATDNQGGKGTSSAIEVRVVAAPKIDSIQRNESGTTLLITGTPGIPHTVEGTTDLVSWTPVGTVTPADAPATITDPSTGGMKFYRVLVE